MHGCHAKHLCVWVFRPIFEVLFVDFVCPLVRLPLCQASCRLKI